MTPTASPQTDRVYLDHNATTPIARRVRERVPGWLELWGNPSSIHQSGRGPKTLMRDSRETIANYLGVNPLELVFTSGGSEANNLALKGVFESFQKPELYAREFRNRYLISSVEHPSIKRTAEYLRSRGAIVETIPVKRNGEIDLAAYETLLTKETALVSVMLANNETGVVHPIKEMAALARSRGALFHTDGVQALGKIEFSLKELGVDLASFSGHKFYALKGAGVLFVKRGVQLESLIHGGGQERHRRGGTENMLAIASLASMCEMSAEVPLRAREMEVLRDHFESRVLEEIPLTSVTAHESTRLPNTSSLLIPGVDGEILLMNLDLRGFSVSTGAACSSGSPEPSPTLLAMGLTRAEAQSSLRVGLGWSTTREEIDRFVETLKDVVRHLRAIDAQENSKGDRDARV
ncbi:MAG: cysteine desulfurase family protein [Bdellovibrionota bacterium]